MPRDRTSPCVSDSRYLFKVGGDLVNLSWSLCKKRKKEGWPSLWFDWLSKVYFVIVSLGPCLVTRQWWSGGWTHRSLWDFRRLLLPWVERPQRISAWLAHVATNRKRKNNETKTSCYKKTDALLFPVGWRFHPSFEVSHSMALNSLQLAFTRSASLFWVIILLPASACAH